MARHHYTADDHQKAFNIWCDSRSLTDVAEALGSDWGTPKRWSQRDYRCPFNCPWHGWTELLEERERAQTAKLLLLSQGINDPVEHDKAIRQAIANPNAPVLNNLDTLVRSDVERLAHLEFFWSKVVFDATGLVTDWRQFRGAGPQNKEAVQQLEDQLKDVLKGGLRCTSMKDAVAMLKVLRSEIESIAGNARNVDVSSESLEDERTSRDDLRKLRKAIKNLSPEELKQLTADDGNRAAAS